MVNAAREGQSQEKLWWRLVAMLACKSFVMLCLWERKTNRTTSHLVPSAVSIRIAGVEQCVQVKRMIGGIGNVSFSTYSQACGYFR